MDGEREGRESVLLVYLDDDHDDLENLTSIFIFCYVIGRINYIDMGNLEK